MTSVANHRCDSCGQTITDIGEAVVVGVPPRATSPQLPATEYLVVHKNLNGRTCDPDGGEPNWELRNLIDPTDGLNVLLSLLSRGPVMIANHGDQPSALDNYVDLVRRLHIPGYEQARPHFHDNAVVEQLDDAAEAYPYTAHTLGRIPGMVEGND